MKFVQFLRNLEEGVNLSSSAVLVFFYVVLTPALLVNLRSFSACVSVTFRR